MKQKFISTNHAERRIRVSLDCSSPVLTDQSSKKSSDINHIMLQYSKTGLLPVDQHKVASYMDNTEIPDLMEAQEQIRAARSLFMELPAKIRKMMDNDPVNLVGFLNDPENHDILKKHNILKEKEKELKQVEPSPSGKVDPPSAGQKKEPQGDA